MNDTLARILAGLALVGVLTNTYISWSSGSQITALQVRLDELRDRRAANAELIQGLARGNGARSVALPVRQKAKLKAKGKGKGKAKRRSEGDVENRRKERVDRRTAKVRETMNVEIDAFARENDLDETVRDDVIDEILMLREGSVLIREDMRDGNLSSFEGRAELRAMREDSDARLDEILGPQLAQALRERFAEGMESRRNEASQ